MVDESPTNPLARIKAVPSTDRYFNYLLAEYELVLARLPDGDPLRAKNAAIIQKANLILETLRAGPNAGSQPSSADPVFIETAILLLLPENELRRRAWMLRERFQSMVGEEAYATYLGSDPPRSDSTDVDLLRSDLSQLMNSIHWVRATTSHRERAQNQIIKRISLGLAVLFTITCGLAFYDVYRYMTRDPLSPPVEIPKQLRDDLAAAGLGKNNYLTMDDLLGLKSDDTSKLQDENRMSLLRHKEEHARLTERRAEQAYFWSLMPLIGFAGAFGAFLSLLHRFKRLAPFGDPVRNSIALRKGAWTIYLVPFMGAAFAFLAYMLLLSGLIQGNFLPALEQYPPPLLEAESNVPRLGSAFALRLGMPKSAGDLARLLLVCFIAGFLERLIPDTLDRLIARRLIHFEGPPPSGKPGEAGGEQKTTSSKPGDKPPSG